MSIDWFHFTPYASLAGGLLIGVAVALFLIFNGRVAGISGIVGGFLRPQAGDVAWRIAFAAGLILAPVLYAGVAVAPEIRIDAGWLTVAAAGLMAGAGTSYGAGCTSGHGVCGVARLSPRSIVATLIFMATGFLTVFVTRHLY